MMTGSLCIRACTHTYIKYTHCMHTVAGLLPQEFNGTHTYVHTDTYACTHTYVHLQILVRTGVRTSKWKLCNNINCNKIVIT